MTSPGSRHRKQRQQSGFRTAAAAQKALTALLATKEAGTYVEPSKQTVGAYLDGWLTGKDRLRATTRTSYASAVRRLTPLIGNIELQALTRADVKAAYAKLAETPIRGGSLPSIKTIHLVHLALHAALEDAVEDDLITRNVADGAHQAPKAGESPEMKTWTPGQIRDFLQFCQSDELQPLFWVAAYTGMRRGEALGARWADFSADDGFLSVRQQISRERNGEWAAIPPKTAAGRRRIDLDAETIGLLKRHRQAQAERSLELGEAYDRASDLIFARADGRFLDPDSVSGIFEKLVRRSGLPAVRLHDLRHSHATILLMNGAPVHLVSQRLGHASPMVTLKVYAHVIPGGQATAAAQFAAAVAGER
jgi:integrase